MKRAPAIMLMFLLFYEPRLVAADGFIDKTGKLVIASTFEAASSFSEGLAAYRSGQKWGFIDRSGTVRITPQFDEVSRFKETRARVRSGRFWGFIDPSGAWIVPAQFLSASDFSEGLAAVATPKDSAGNGGWGYLDSTGRMVIAPQFYWARSFSEGLAVVRRSGGKTVVGKDSLGRSGIGVLEEQCVFIDKTGAVVIVPEPQFSAALAFREGLAYVYNHGPDGRMRGGPSGYIDKSGRMVVRSAQYSVSPLGECMTMDSEIAGFGAEGMVEAASFHEGLALHDAGTGTVHVPKWSYINTKGAVVLSPEIHGGSYFSEGLARIMKGRLSLRYGFIDKTGKMVIEPSFHWAEPFMEGLAAVKVGKKWGFVDPTGRMAVEARFESASSFREGLARVTLP